MTTREGLFCKTRNYLQQSDHSSSSPVFSEAVVEANKSNMVISCDYYDDHRHHGNEYMKMKLGEMEMEEEEMINGEDEEKKRKKKKKKKRVEKVRKPRFAFQTRSQVDILDDGYRWRKYGQKAVKNNKFPRSYYRCTHQSCNVKKQVQRLSKDEEVVVTTYEGKHTHPIERNNDNFEHILNQMQIYTGI